MKRKKQLQDHCYIFSKKVFKNVSGCKKWLKIRNIKIPKTYKSEHIDKEIIITLRSKSRFNKKRRKQIRKGVKVIKGYLK